MLPQRVDQENIQGQIYPAMVETRVNLSIRIRELYCKTSSTEEFTGLRELRIYTNSLIVASVHASTFMAASPEEKRTFIQEFVFFLKTFGVIGLAIAFVIGQAASALVNAFVKDIIDPFIGLFLPAGSLAAVTIKVPNLAGTSSEFKIGDLISNIINFIVIALVVFVAYKQLSRYGIVEDKTKGEKK